MRIHAVLPAVATLALFARTAPPAPEISLGQRNAAIADPFSDLNGLAELKDGRVMVTDRVETALIIADFRTGTRKQIGRNGSGPNEYVMPYGPLGAKGDTLFAYDGRNHRYLKVSAEGTFYGTVPFPTHQPAGITSWAAPRAVDAMGRLYWDSAIIQMQPTMTRLMKARIIRWVPGADTTDIVMEFGDHGEFEHRFVYRPFPQTDAWVVAPDGRIGILSAAEYRLRWYKDGALVETGPVLAYDRIKVGASERDAFRMKKAMDPLAGGMSRGGGGNASAGMERAKADWGDTLFPEFLPPFETAGALRAPNGNIWVKRTSAASEKSARIDVLDAHGALRGFVKLAPRSRLLAVSASSVYIVAADEDGLQTLERYAMPAALK